MSASPDVGPEGPDLRERWMVVLPYRDRLLRVARRQALNAEDAEDCVQEALLRAVAVEPFDATRIEGWLVTVVRRLAVDQHRDRTRCRRAGTRAAMRELPEPAPDEVVLDAAEANWLREHVAGLAGRERDVLVHRAAGMSPTEAARALGVSDKAANSAYTRARHHLQVVWRATLAWLGLTRLSRPGRAGGMVAVPAALLVTALVAVSPLDLPGDHRPSRPRVVEPEAMVREAVPPGTGKVGSGPSSGAAANPGSRRRAGAERQIVTVEAGDRDVVAVRVEETRKHEEESFLDTVNRCLRNGLEISEQRTGCAEDPE